MSKTTILIPFLLLLVAFILTPHATLASGPQQEGYPPPPEPEVATPTLTSQPYPDAGGATPMPIGVQAGVEANGANNATALDTGGRMAQIDGNRGILILWVGFLATCLVFLTSVVGSIILFTRRNDS